MHSGFTNLRLVVAHERPRPQPPYRVDAAALEADIGRIGDLERLPRAVSAPAAPGCSEEYTIADAMYAPVVLRFNTYGAGISPTARWYMAGVFEDAACRNGCRGRGASPGPILPAKWVRTPHAPPCSSSLTETSAMRFSPRLALGCSCVRCPCGRGWPQAA